MKKRPRKISFMQGLCARDPEEAGNWILLAAENGDPEALHEVGEYYRESGRCEEAAVWHRRAAEKGHAGSQVTMAHMFYEGSLKPRDLQAMVHWYFQASEEIPVARVMLGECYRYGRGVPQSFETAIRWFLRGEEHSDAQRRLRACHAFFKASPWEYDRAYAVETRKAHALRAFGGRETWRELTPEQLAEGLRRLTEYEKTISAG